MQKNRRWLLILAGLLVALGTLPAGCAAGQTPVPHELAMAPMADMPADVQAAPAPVREAYQFAAANPDVLSQVPCYCGCGALGHVNNYDCYFTGQPDDGSQAFESHALNCIICVDITQDAMRLLREGKSPAEIRDYVDTNYSRYGPSNMPG